MLQENRYYSTEGFLFPGLDSKERNKPLTEQLIFGNFESLIESYISFPLLCNKLPESQPLKTVHICYLNNFCRSEV